MIIKKNIPYAQRFENSAFTIHHKQFWWASWYAQILGYQSLKSMMTAINKAIQDCATIDIDISEHFILTKRVVDEFLFEDYRLSKFACYLIAINADSRKAEVKETRSYFADYLGQINTIEKDRISIDRIVLRKEIKSAIKQLNKSAAAAGVHDFQAFTNEGYLGLYNHTLRELKIKRSIPANKSIFDYMNQTELIANLFRMMLTEENLHVNPSNEEQLALNQHHQIAHSIRTLVNQYTGKFPEELLINKSLNQLSRNYKKVSQLLQKASI